MNMKDFFDFSIEYTNKNGFGRFSVWHFLWLGVGAAFIFFLCRLYGKAGTGVRKKLRFTVAGAALGEELFRSALLMLNGAYDISRLPLHLCGLAIYISAVHALTGNKLIGQFLYAFCMPGAVFALLFPDWDYYPLLHFMSFTGFELHILIVTYTVMQVYAGDIHPESAKAPACLGIMLCLAAAVYVFDKITETNFMFLNWPSPGSPLEWFSSLGSPGYILGYIPILAVVWTVLYLPFTLKNKP